MLRTITHNPVFQVIDGLVQRVEYGKIAVYEAVTEHVQQVVPPFPEDGFRVSRDHALR